MSAVSYHCLFPETERFRIDWQVDYRKPFDFHLTFEPPLQGKTLLEEIARRQNIEARKIQLIQKRARKLDGTMLVLSWGGWCNEDGDLHAGNEVEKKVCKIEDEEMVPFVRNRLTDIIVAKR